MMGAFIRDKLFPYVGYYNITEINDKPVISTQKGLALRHIRVVLGAL